MSPPEPRVRTEPPGPGARALAERDGAVASACHIKAYPLAVARGAGAMLEDVDGNRYLDFMAGIGAASTGHAHPRVVAAIRKAAGRFLHVCATDFYYEGHTALMERLAGLAPGGGPWRVFLTNSGTEAVDGALKLARRATGRTDVVAFEGAFHGRSYGGMSLTASRAVQRRGFGPMVPGVHHVPYGHCSRCAYGKRYPDCRLHCVSVLEERLFDRRVDPSDVAALFVEPVLGEGGYVVPPTGWLPAIRELCDRHGILMVADEIQTGIGRTGRMFACEHWGVVPDVVLAAKGLGSGMPIGAIVARQDVDAWESGSHGSTFGGNPVCCAAALATLDLVEEELVERAARLGPRLLDGVRALAGRHDAVGDVRGLGLMVGMEMVRPGTGADAGTGGGAAGGSGAGGTPGPGAPAPELAHAVVGEAFRRGLLLLEAGASTVRLLPPLVIEEEEIDRGLEILDGVLEAVA